MAATPMHDAWTIVSRRLCSAVVLCVVLPGCGGSGTEPSPPATSGSSGPALSRLELFPNRFVALIGEALPFRVIARDTAGAEVSNVVPTYSSSNTAVVRVDPGGNVVANSAGMATVRATAGGQTAESVIHVGTNTYDSAQGPPRVLNASYIELSKVERVSRFRSTVGHAYVDGSGETCRSMKHYFQPRQSIDWTSVEIYAPASGTIWLIATDGAAGFRVMLRPRDFPALEVALFHVNLDPAVVRNTWVEAGDRIGRHASPFTMSDIATGVGGKEGTLFSYFETMTDAVFSQFQSRGVTSRQAAIITRAERDQDQVPCVGEQQFTVQGRTPDWVVLN